MTILISILRFPLDVLFLTIDWIRALWLRVRRKLFGGGAPCPFCVLDKYQVDASRVCPAALKYGSPGLFRRICGGVTGARSGKDGLPRCTLESVYETPWKPILSVGLVLVLFWGGLGAFLQARFGLFTHLYQLAFVPVASVPIAEMPEDEDLASLEIRLKGLSLEDTRTDHEKALEYLQEADDHFAAGAYNIARLEYAIAIKRDSEIPRAYRQLGLCHLEESDFEAAEPPLRRALEIDPTDVKAHLAMAEVAAALLQPERAFSHAHAILQLEPGNVLGLLRLVNFYQAVGNREAATRAAEEALAVAPDDPETLYKAAAMYSVLQDSEHSEELLRRCLEVDPEHVEALTSLAAHELNRADIDGAKELLVRAETLDPEALSAQALRAELAGVETNVQAAIDAYHNLVDAHPEYTAGANRLADLLMRTRQHDRLYELADDLAGRTDPVTAARGNLLLARLWLAKHFFGLAITSAEEAMAASPHADGARFVLAQAHLARTEFREALGYLEPLFDKHPNQPAIHLMTIRSLLALNREAEAEASYHDFIARHPESAAGVKLMGDHYFEQKDFERAEEAYQEALHLEPKNALIRYDLSMLLAENDQGLARSELLAQQMKEENNENALYYDILGWVYHQQGRTDDAIELLQKAVAQVPREAVFRYHLGAALVDVAPDLARQHLALALNISTNFFGLDKAQALLTSLPEPEEDE